MDHLRKNITIFIRYIVQLILVTLSWVFIARFKRPSVNVKIDGRQRTVIAANHINALDPFAIVASMGWKNYFKLAPFCFMTANVFFRMKWLRPLLWLAGCFPAHPNGRSPFGVDGAVRLINDGYTLCMFPEGRRAFEGRLPAKPGISSITKELESPRLIVAHIEWSGTSIKRIAFAAHKKAKSSPEEIMDAVYGL